MCSSDLRNGARGELGVGLKDDGPTGLAVTGTSHRRGECVLAQTRELFETVGHALFVVFAGLCPTPRQRAVPFGIPLVGVAEARDGFGRQLQPQPGILPHTPPKGFTLWNPVDRGDGRRGRGTLARSATRVALGEAVATASSRGEARVLPGKSRRSLRRREA